jgi:hypothetical protein
MKTTLAAALATVSPTKPAIPTSPARVHAPIFHHDRQQTFESRLPSSISSTTSIQQPNQHSPLSITQTVSVENRLCDLLEEAIITARFANRRAHY